MEVVPDNQFLRLQLGLQQNQPLHHLKGVLELCGGLETFSLGGRGAHERQSPSRDALKGGGDGGEIPYKLNYKTTYMCTYTCTCVFCIIILAMNMYNNVDPPEFNIC